MKEKWERERLDDDERRKIRKERNWILKKEKREERGRRKMRGWTVRKKLEEVRGGKGGWAVWGEGGRKEGETERN